MFLSKLFSPDKNHLYTEIIQELYRNVHTHVCVWRIVQIEEITHWADKINNQNSIS